MRFLTVFLVLLLLLGIGSAQGGSPPSLARGAPGSLIPPGLAPVDARHGGTLHGGIVGAKQADPDTIYMLGGRGRADGKFQSGTGGTLPDRQGWIGADLTVKTTALWNVSTWNGRAILDTNFTPNHTMWCGELLNPCPGGDPPQGYRNGYDEWLDWYGTVADNTIATSVTVTCVLNNDSEPGYDYLRFAVSRSTGQDELINYTGENTLVDFSQTFTVATADYVGPSLNQIHLRFRATSDGGWSDGDCRWPTYGHSELDNIQVTTDNGVNTYDNFEGGAASWHVAFPPSCGDFSKVWSRLTDLDPCNANDTPLFAFVDDGIVAPGTGGTPGITWTYGPGGYVFNPNGGLAGAGYHVQNEIWSPELAWPVGETKQYTGMQFNFCAYQHLPLTIGTFYVWHIRSSTDGGLTWGGWVDDNFVYYGTTADWLDVTNTVTSLLPVNRTHVQVALGAWDWGWIWGFHNGDPTPAPYFDNVRVLAYVFPGPAISSRDIDLFQASNFPAIGTIDYGNLGNNSVRLDMANNISQQAHLKNDPGDSIVVNVAVVRTGATLQGLPKMYYKLKPNHLFDAYRTSGLPNTGFVNGDTTKTSNGSTIANSWRWDLPDSNFFFPGDQLHYYFEAQDNLAGSIGTTRMPPDTSGFSKFPGDPGFVPLLWENKIVTSSFTVNALPTMNSATPNDQPRMLFWNDAPGYGGDNEWVGALTNLGYEQGSDYDLYYTSGPSSGVGNGLGGRATGPQLAGYNVMLYTSGDLGDVTLSNGDFTVDPGNDVAVMGAWLAQGNKKWFATGDDLAYDLGKSGAAALNFRTTYLPMTFVADELRPLIQNQINPVVEPVAGNPVGLTASYIAYGGCQIFNKFDAVEATTGSQRIATFRQVSGAAYPYAAALYVPNAGSVNDQVVYLPYDFQFIYNAPNGAKADANRTKRAQVLQQVLTFFGRAPSHPGTGVDDTPGLAFSAKNFPNPFNPSTKIEYSLPRDGQLTIKVFNVRGELVRTLLDRPVTKGPGSVTWLGDDDRGQKVASGVYFYQVKSAGSEIFNKMTLVK